MMAFFVMGFIDLTGIGSNYVKADFGLTDTAANIFPSLVFIWFLLFSVPLGMLMNRIGRKKTVLIGLYITLAALALLLTNYSLIIITLSFSLLGIGNTVMQVSLNPLISNIVPPKKTASALTMGQMVKAVASFTAPIIAAWSALYFGNWRILFLVYLVQGVIAAVMLQKEQIKEEEISVRAPSIKNTFSLLKDPFILALFTGITCHVGIDVGINVTVPRLVAEKLNTDLYSAGYVPSIYFLFRIAGAMAGIYILAKFSNKKFFVASIVLITAALAGFCIFKLKFALYACVAVCGFANANIFSILFSQALKHLPKMKNEISGLMITGIFGGTLFLFFMGIMSDITLSQNGAVAVMGAGALYLIILSLKLK